MLLICIANKVSHVTYISRMQIIWQSVSNIYDFNVAIPYSYGQLCNIPGFLSRVCSQSCLGVYTRVTLYNVYYANRPPKIRNCARRYGSAL